ncbi:T9SS type A sorting domain-containing protein, partial [bacterium]
FAPKDLIFTSNGEAIIVGSKNTIIKTYDYGENWLIVSHSDTSNVVINNVVSRSPYEIFMTESNNNKLLYTLDGFKSILEVVVTDIMYFSSSPITYNKFDDNFYTSGELIVSPASRPVETYNYHYKRFKSKYFNQIYDVGKGYTYEGSRGNSCCGSLDYLGVIQGVVIGVRETELKKFRGEGGPDDAEKMSLYDSDYRISNLVTYKNNAIVIDVKGNIAFLTDMYFDNDFYNQGHFNQLIVNVTDTILYDYSQLKDNKGIATSIKGKYFIYDTSGSIDSLINDSTVTFPIGTKDGLISNNSIEVYPNPTTFEFTIVFKAEVMVNSIYLYNLRGAEMLKVTPNQEMDEYTMNIKNLQRAPYFLKIITNKGIYNKKIIKF